MILTETWLSAKLSCSEIFQCQKSFCFYRCDRGARSGGGVLIAVADHLQSFHIPLATPLEVTCACIRIKHQNAIFCVCYRPPNAPSSFCSDLHDALNTIIVRFPKSHIFLLGDFNYPQIIWSGSSPTVSCSSREATEFLDFCSTFHFSQLVTQPTRTSLASANVLDLVLTSSPDLVHSLAFTPGLSDHCFIHFSVNTDPKRTVSKPKRIRDYRKADFSAINSELEAFLGDYMAQFYERTVNANWVLFKDKVHYLIKKYIPLRIIPCKHRAPWFNISLKRLLNRKKRLFRKARQRNHPDAWSKYRHSNEIFKKAVKKAKNVFFKDTLPLLLVENTKKFWSVIGGPKNSSVSLVDETGVVVPRSKSCIVLNDVFKRAFTQPSSNASSLSIEAVNFPQMERVVVDWVGILPLIKNLKVSSSSGVDGINSKFLKNTEVYSSIILAQIFTQSMNSSILPDDWKVGKVVPLFKSGDSHNPSNYRPISITSISCKLFEHVIYSHLVTFLEDNAFFSSCQHGFRKSFSCETQLISFTHDLFCALDNEFFVDCIFLDFSKAFDLVSHQLLCMKLRKLNIDSHILAWIENFLSNRTQFVTANEFDSTYCSVTSGVPQGSVLGPLLFLIYINDLPSTITSSIRLFADDCVLYRTISSDSDLSTLQSDLNKVCNWCVTWQMRLNINKCKTMRISRRFNPTEIFMYKIEGRHLEATKSYKYLGVHITHNLSWETHVNYIVNNANRTLGYLRRNFSSAPSDLKSVLYKTLIRPKLEYACAVWDPGHDYLTNALESAQNRSARFILANYSRTSSVTSMKLTLNLPSLSLRRKIARLNLFHKIYHFNPILKNELLSNPSYISQRTDHPYKVSVPQCRTNQFFHSFIPKTSNEWNHLPTSIATIIDARAFRSAVESYFCSS